MFSRRQAELDSAALVEVVADDQRVVHTGFVVDAVAGEVPEGVADDAAALGVDVRVPAGAPRQSAMVL